MKSPRKHEVARRGPAGEARVTKKAESRSLEPPRREKAIELEVGRDGEGGEHSPETRRPPRRRA